METEKKIAKKLTEAELFKREHWGEGPWSKEPDRVQFRFASLPCIANRNQMGAWCGYVGVPPGHPFHGLHYDKVDVQVHGGLTYADKCHGVICHKPRKGESPEVWWFGFDCAHSGDLVPGLEAVLREIRKEKEMPKLLGVPAMVQVPKPWRDVYRTLGYVKKQIRILAAQLAKRSLDPVKRGLARELDL